MHGIIYPPDDVNERFVWREKLHQWRNTTRDLIQYDDSIYGKPEFAWVPRTFCLGILMMADLQFYDPTSGQYTLDRLLDEAIQEFGGYDAIMLWHAYPKIGFDDRNQFDFYRETVGGLAGLRALVNRCHARGVKVYVDYNPWDTGTRREPVTHVESLVTLVTAIDADAIFLDTMAFAAAELRARLDQSRPGVALESEVLVPIEHLHTHPASWTQSLPAGNLPGVLRNKWFERRHMQHRIKRWQRDHTEELHLAWMNGTGIVVWENVFGTYVGWSQRDRSILRAMLPIQRRYADLLVAEGWQPLVETQNNAVCASLWEGVGIQLWTLCNRSETEIAGTLLTISYQDGLRFFDLIRAEPVAPYIVDERGAQLQATLRPRGIGAIIAGHSSDFDDNFYRFLEQQRLLDRCANFAVTPPRREETLIPVERTPLRTSDSIPDGMVPIPARTFELTVQFRVRECGFYHIDGMPPLDLRYPALHTTKTISRPVIVAAFALDEAPVTNAQFALFLQQTGYHPDHPENFLKHWPGGQLPTALEAHPVVYIVLEDMWAYARWAGKRLPREAEWQHAAQGFDELTYPWGVDYMPGRCNDGAAGTTTPVRAFPDGHSPFGCYDMCGNVWEMTESEYTDGRTHFCILKGGSYYRAVGSEWYTDGGPQPNTFSAKMILAWPGLDRCAIIGFRCALDVGYPLRLTPEAALHHTLDEARKPDSRKTDI